MVMKLDKSFCFMFLSVFFSFTVHKNFLSLSSLPLLVHDLFSVI